MFYNFSNNIINHVLSPPMTLPHLSTHLNSNSLSPKTKENELKTKNTHTHNQTKLLRVYLDICTRVWLKHLLSYHWRKLLPGAISCKQLHCQRWDFCLLPFLFVAWTWSVLGNNVTASHGHQPCSVEKTVLLWSCSGQEILFIVNNNFLAWCFNI